MARPVNIVFNNVFNWESKDTQELTSFNRANNGLFCFILELESGKFCICFSSKEGYTFSLSSQRRVDRNYGIRLFKSLDSAYSYSKKLGFESVLLVKENSVIRTLEGCLIVNISIMK